MSTGNPEIIIKNQAIDIELAELLGEKQCDFIVLCFDGQQLDFFGTPYDGPNARRLRQSIVEALNDRSKKSLWPKMFSEWKPEILRQFKLPPETTAKDFRPVVSLKISRVCHAYSEHLHAAISLFETLDDKVEWWSVGKMSDGKHSVIIRSKNGKEIDMSGDKLAVVIAAAIRDLLKGQTNADRK